jgi:hypothetical protein
MDTSGLLRVFIDALDSSGKMTAILSYMLTIYIKNLKVFDITPLILAF